MSLGRVWVYWVLCALATLLLALMTLGPAAAAGTQAAARRALVIGIDGYSDPLLTIPGNRTGADALAVADVLENVARYDTVMVVPRNADKQAFIDKLADFADTINDKDMVFVFYSGHGVEFENDNYLMLSSALAVLPENKIKRAAELDRASIAQSYLMKTLLRRNPLNVVLVINACRTSADEGPDGLGPEDGQFQFDAPSNQVKAVPGTMVIYSTSAGTPARVCLDKDCTTDPSPMTVFTRRFVESLKEPNMAADDLVTVVGTAVEDDVSTSVGDVQRVSVANEISFKLRKTLYLGPVGDLPRPPSDNLEDSLFAAASNANTVDGWTKLLNAYPHGKFAGKARDALAVLQSQQESSRFAAASIANTAEGWTSFLADFPNGAFAGRARSALDLLGRQEEANRFTVAVNLNSVEAWNDFLRDYPNGMYSATAQGRLEALLTPPEPTRYLATYNDLDFFGSDIATAHAFSFESCAATCNDYRGCTAFTFNKNTTKTDAPNCFLKDGTGQANPFPAAFSGVIFDPNEEDAPTFGFDSIESENLLLTDTDITFHDFSNDPLSGVRTLAGCRLACLNDSSCEAFSYVVRLKQCWPKTTDGPTSYKPGIITGIKQSFTRTPIEVRDLSK